MTVPAGRKDKNIRLSINKFIDDAFSTPNSIDTNFQDRTFDVSAKNKWIEVIFLSGGAGRKAASLIQIDLYTRIRGKITGGDVYSDELNVMADLLTDALHVDSMPVYDWSTPASPALISNMKIIIQNSNGTFREPEADTDTSDLEEGVARRTITYRVRMLTDTSQARSYYD